LRLQLLGVALGQRLVLALLIRQLLGLGLEFLGFLQQRVAGLGN